MNNSANAYLEISVILQNFVKHFIKTFNEHLAYSKTITTPE